MSIGILFSEQLREYDFGPGHPFRGDRYLVFPDFLKKNLPEDDNYRMFPAEPASEEDLRLICVQEYIDFTRDYYRAVNLGISYGGDFYRYHSGDNLPAGRPGKLEEAARYIIGQAKEACRLVQGGDFQKVVSLGGGLHHAKPSYGEGFCLYNDVAFAGRFLLEKYGLTRVLILDTDAHAGNGTGEYFYGEPRVLFIDIHQDPRTLYPGTGFVRQIGAGEGTGFTVNIPMPVGAGDESYRMVFESVVEPLCREFRPEIIIRNGGSDPHFSDGLTGLGLTVPGFHMLGERVREMSRICGGREIDLIASGYNAEVLPHAWLALLSGLAGFPVELKEPSVSPRLRSDDSSADTGKVIREVRDTLKEYWSCLR